MTNSKKSIAIFQETLNNIGGGDLVCLTMLDILIKEGIVTTLITTEKTNWKKIFNAFDIDKFQINFHEIIIPFKNPPKIFGVYYKFVIELYLSFRFSKKFDLFINCIGNYIPLKSNITYLHHAKFLSQFGTFSKQSVLRKLYLIPYVLLKKLHYVKYFENTYALCNSKYVFDLLNSSFPNCNASILYPPVNIKSFKNNSIVKKPIVVTCSRFVPKKNLHLIPSIASQTPDIEYHIIGSTNKDSKIVLKQIYSEIKKLHCTNVYLHKDINKKDLEKWYQKATIYLHTMFEEDFGISIVEGMSFGLIPVVHKSGGPFFDIIDKDKYGFSYNKPEEAAKIISLIMHDSIKQNILRQIVKERSNLFGNERFKHEFLRVIKKML